MPFHRFQLSRWVVGFASVATSAAAQISPPPPPQPSGAPTQATEAPAPATATDFQLDEAERADSGRGLAFFWLEPQVGFRGVHLLDAAVFDGAMIPKDSYGLGIGAGAGVRLLYFTLGVGFEYGVLSAWDTWSLDLDLALRVPLGRFEPYVGLGGGFVSLEGATDASSSIVVGAAGANLGLHGGLDYFVTDVFSVGVRVSADLLIVGRSALTDADAAGTIYGAGASGVALSYEPSLVLGLHL